MISLEVIDLSFAFCKIRKKHLKCHRRGYKFCIVVSKYITLDTSKSRGDFLRNIVAIVCAGFNPLFPLRHLATPLLLDSLEFFRAKEFRRKGVFPFAPLGATPLLLGIYIV